MTTVEDVRKVWDALQEAEAELKSAYDRLDEVEPSGSADERFAADLRFEVAVRRRDLEEARHQLSIGEYFSGLSNNGDLSS